MYNSSQLKSIRTHTRSHVLRQSLTCPLNLEAATVFGSRRPICLGLKISPISRWGTTLLLEPSLGLATRIPRPDDRGAHGTKESERDGSRKTQRREAEKSRDSREVAPGVAKPFPCGLSPLFPPHRCKLQASPGPQGLHKPGKCPMVGREMWVSYSPPGIGHPCGYRGLRREPRAFPERSPAGSELAPGSATCQLCA